MNAYESLKEWRKNKKQKLVEALGSCCQICGYNKSNTALEFHHISAIEKDFSLSSNKISKNWNNIKIEASKCILLCANCHREVHDGTTALPINYQKFDENLIQSGKEKPNDTPCVVCNTLKDYKLICCSRKCSAIYSTKINITEQDIVNLLIKHNGNVLAIARELGISDNGFRKKCIKLNIEYKNYK